MSKNYIIGFPRIGEQRELKKVLELFWAKKCLFSEVEEVASQLKKRHWNYQKEAGIGFISSNDFSLYDNMLDTAILLGAIPKRFQELKDEEQYLVSSYFLRSDHDYKEAFKMGYFISLIHTLSALSITFILYYIIETIFSQTFQELSFYMTKISALLIIGVAIYLFFEEHQEHNTLNTVQKSDLSVAFSAGVVPCPGVMTILLFSILMGQIWVGIVSAIFMSVGMGLTISLSAIVATATRSSTPKKITSLFPLLGNIMILLLGVYLLVI